MKDASESSKVKWWHFIAVPAVLGLVVLVLTAAFLALDWAAGHIVHFLPPFHH